MLNFGRFFVDIQPEKLTIKHGASAKNAVVALVVERNHVDGFVAMLQEARKDMVAREAVFESVDVPLYIKSMCDKQFKELVEDVKANSVSDVATKWGIGRKDSPTIITKFGGGSMSNMPRIKKTTRVWWWEYVKYA